MPLTATESTWLCTEDKLQAHSTFLMQVVFINFILVVTGITLEL
ncbi:hypothetical protein DSUL_100132 [Desulfovibrionales bacterium]